MGKGDSHSTGAASSSGFLWVGASVLMLILASYWWLLIDNQHSQFHYAEQQVALRAQQTSEALAAQVHVLVSGLDYLGESLSAQYIENNEGFPAAVEDAIAIFEQDTILQVAVADETGRIIYSNLAPDSRATATQFSIANREHFLVHAEGRASAAGLYVSNPLQGRISGQWSIQFAQPLSRDGAFAGVLVVSVSPGFISEYFQKVFPRSGGDVALLLNDRGYYLARSSQQDEVIGSQVSEQLRAGIASGTAGGEYRLQPAWDAVERDYAWRWVQGYPLAVSVGLDRQAALAPVTDRFAQSRLWNAISTLAVLLSLLLIAVLVRRLRAERQRLAWNEERLTNLLAQVPGAVYQFRRQPDGTSEMLYISPGSTALIGFTPGRNKEEHVRHIRYLPPRRPSGSAC